MGVEHYINTVSSITKVVINNLWGEATENYVWELQPDVNILVGTNGSGKSSFLNLINSLSVDNDGSYYRLFEEKTEVEIYLLDFPEKSFVLSYDSLINNAEDIVARYHDFDAPLELPISASNIQLLNFLDLDIPLKEGVEYAGQKVKKVVDIQLYELISKFYAYQSDIALRMVAIYRENGIDRDEKATILYANIALFEKLVNELFSETNKKIVLQKGFYFGKNDKKIEPIRLSSGEKHLLILFLTVLLQDKQNAILLLDEPEISLHYSWQEKLIEYLRELNPNCQLIIATHSGSIFIEGWADKVQHIQNLKLQS
jgi:predicted ATP-dependent endonuclease of OLD family